MKRHIDRRQFLAGMGGAVLALPMLEFFTPRRAYAQSTPTAPKRLLIITHHNGRGVGDGRSAQGGGRNDWWSPRTDSGPLPAGMSPMLAGIDSIRGEVVTFDGIDNIVRHATGDGDGHMSSLFTGLTCVPFASNNRAGGPSIDHVAGLRLRASDSMPPSLILPVSATPEGTEYRTEHHYAPSGAPARTLSGNPQQAIEEVFASVVPSEPPPAPTLAERMKGRRKSILDAVAKECTTLRGKLNAHDRDQLDRYTDFIRATEKGLSGGGGGTVVTQGCAPPDPADAPHVYPQTYEEYRELGGRNPEFERGHSDALTVPYQVETVVQAFACDVTRVMCLSFASDLDFAREFPVSTPFLNDDSYHSKVHGAQRPADEPRLCDDLRGAYQHFGWVMNMAVSRLAAFQDVDGNRLLDNTLVLWVSELGYGADHLNNNIPVVMAGMKSAFPKGQGRHVVCSPRRTLGDVYAHVLRMLGGTDMTFGVTGTLGQAAAANGVSGLNAGAGLSGYINADTPLHNGPLDV